MLIVIKHLIGRAINVDYLVLSFKQSEHSDVHVFFPLALQEAKVIANLHLVHFPGYTYLFSRNTRQIGVKFKLKRKSMCNCIKELVGEQMDRRLANDLCPLILTFWIITCDSWLCHSVCCGDFLKDFITFLGKGRYTRTWVL